MHKIRQNQVIFYIWTVYQPKFCKIYSENDQNVLNSDQVIKTFKHCLKFLIWMFSGVSLCVKSWCSSRVAPKSCLGLFGLIQRFLNCDVSPWKLYEVKDSSVYRCWFVQLGYRSDQHSESSFSESFTSLDVNTDMIHMLVWFSVTSTSWWNHHLWINFHKFT